MRTGFVFLTILLGFNAFTQSAPQQNPCTSAEAKQFDFWLGDWDLTWKDSVRGSNHVEKVVGGCAVQENFFDPKMNYSGKSWSVYNAQRKMWQQTWVDSQGGYIVLTGGMQGDSMVLTTPARPTAQGSSVARMVYYNIKPDSFNWSWESSTDNGITWKVNWLIHYKRKTR